MSSPAVATLLKMMEALPEPAQERVVGHVREYIANLEDELKWEAQFKKTQNKLVAGVRKARQERALGQARPMDVEAL